MKPQLAFLLLIANSVLAQPPTSVVAPAAPSPAPTPAVPGPSIPDTVRWHDVTTWGVEGRAWAEQERLRWFDRFPAAAEKTVTRAVWDLSRDSAGMMVRFKTDATAIYVQYKLAKTQEQLGMWNMPPSGVSGIDLYARDAAGKLRWVQVARARTPEVRIELVRDLAPGLREYAAYLPLFNRVESLSIGVPPGAAFEGLAPRTAKPIVFYGTSITHGIAASRPGMVHTAILGRRFDMPVINLGFSGNGRMDAAVGEFLTQIDAALFVIDCLPNMGPADVRTKAVPLVRQLRAARPNTPIVLVEDRRQTNDWIIPARAKFHDDNHAALREVFETLQREGMKNLHYIPGDHLYGDDAEGATDGSHASDLGFVRQADVMEPILRAALNLK